MSVRFGRGLRSSFTRSKRSVGNGESPLSPAQITERVATGRRKDLCGLVEKLPDLLVDVVRKTVVECLSPIALDAGRGPRSANESSLLPQEESVLDARCSSLSAPPRSPRIRGLPSTASSHDGNFIGIRSSSQSDILSQPTERNGGSSAPAFCSMRTIVKAHEERMFEGIKTPYSVARSSYNRQTPLASIIPVMKQTAHSHYKCLTLSSLQQLRVDDLTNSVGWSSPCLRQCSSPLDFRLWGLLPWSETKHRPRFSFSWCYSWLIVALAGVAFLSHIVSAIFLCPDDARRLVHTARILVTMAAFALAIQVQSLTHHDIVGFPSALLCNYAVSRCFDSEWRKYTRFRSVATNMLCGIVALSVLTPHFFAETRYTPYRVAMSFAFSFSCGLVLTMSSLVWHICSALSLAVDAFGTNFTDSPDFPRAIADWNVMRAVALKVSATISPVLCTLVAVATSGIVILFVAAMVLNDWVEIMEPFWPTILSTIIPAATIPLSITCTLLKAASVTEACKVVPQMVNSWSLGVDLDEDRSYVADYMYRSNAGFYFLGVRLTLAAVLKSLNSAALVAGTLLVRMFAHNA